MLMLSGGAGDERAQPREGRDERWMLVIKRWCRARRGVETGTWQVMNED